MRRAGIALFFLIVIVSAFVVERAFVHQPAAASPEGSCSDQYNALVRQAKENLIQGDRIAAINSLVQARTKLHSCESRSAEDVKGSWSN
jgi:hypothetical protein